LVAVLGPAFDATIVYVNGAPGTYGFGLLDFVIDSSATGTGVVVAVPVLLPGVGSNVVDVPVAVFKYVPLASTVAVIVSVALPPAASGPMVHTPPV
jgi:hypothetical protein